MKKIIIRGLDVLFANEYGRDNVSAPFDEPLEFDISKKIIMFDDRKLIATLKIPYSRGRKLQLRVSVAFEKLIESANEKELNNEPIS